MRAVTNANSTNAFYNAAVPSSESFACPTSPATTSTTLPADSARLHHEQLRSKIAAPELAVLRSGEGLAAYNAALNDAEQDGGKTADVPVRRSRGGNNRQAVSV